MGSTTSISCSRFLLRHAHLAHSIAAPLQTGANRTPIRIGARATCGRALIDLRLSLLRLRLGVGIRRRSYDGAGGAPDEGARAGIARPPDDRTDDRAADGAGYGTGTRGIRRLHDDPFIGTRARAARIHTRLLDSPDMTFITIAVGLFRTLAVRGIDEYPLRRGSRNRISGGARRH